jgi:hypothetical protein
MTTPGLAEALLEFYRMFVMALAMFAFGLIVLSRYIHYYYVLSIIAVIALIVICKYIEMARTRPPFPSFTPPQTIMSCEWRPEKVDDPMHKDPYADLPADWRWVYMPDCDDGQCYQCNRCRVAAYRAA